MMKCCTAAPTTNATRASTPVSNSMNMFEIAHSLHRQYGPDPWCIYRGKHLMNFVDNHDVTRLASILTNKEHIRPAYGLLNGHAQAFHVSIMAVNGVKKVQKHQTMIMLCDRVLMHQSQMN